MEREPELSSHEFPQEEAERKSSAISTGGRKEAETKEPSGRNTPSEARQ
jgi:hypothetical protein